MSRGPNNPNNSSARRSAPGRGELVRLYLVDIERVDRGYTDEDSGLQGGLGEDFADTVWPVVVKAKRSVNAADLVRSLRTLADAVEGGFYLQQDDTKPARVLSFPSRGNL